MRNFGSLHPWIEPNCRFEKKGRYYFTIGRRHGGTAARRQSGRAFGKCSALWLPAFALTTALE
jgi:hypothetical protein